jgi:hypothetical protein
MKTEFKHTKGEWKVFMGNYGTFCSINTSTTCRVAEIHVPKNINDKHSGRAPISEASANAYLIAAAPDLLNALDNFIEAIDAITGKEGRKYMERGRLAAYDSLKASLTYKVGLNAINKALNLK